MDRAKQISNLEQHKDYPYDVFEVGDQAAVRHYTDVEPCTVIEVNRNGREVTVQLDSYELAEGQRPDVTPGGFMGYCTNQRDLEYNITRNEGGAIMSFTIRKWRGRYCWTPKDCTPNGHQHIKLGWYAFYDYNF